MRKKPNEVLIADIPNRVVGGFKPAKGVGRGWVKVDYETKDFSGVGVSTGFDSKAPELVIDLGLEGDWVLYLGVGWADSIRVWLDGEENSLRDIICQHGGTAFQECRLHKADLTGRKLHIAPIPVERYRAQDPHAFLGYIRAVKTDYAPKPTKASRTAVGSIDGYSWIAVYGLSCARDVGLAFSPYRDSDVYRVLYNPIGADVTGNHMTKVGTTAPFDTVHAYRQCDRQYALNTKRILESGEDILAAAATAAKEVGVELHFYIRPEAFYCPFPNDHIFTSQFLLKNPQWRCKDEFGEEVLRMSYAYPEVREHMLAYIEELMGYNPGGICFAFSRSMPMMICEEPVLAAYEAKHGRRPKLPEEVDSPELVAVRQEILTGYIVKLAAFLKKRKAVFTCIVDANHERNHLMGLNLEDMLAKGLVESVYVAGKCLDSAYWKGLKEKYPKVKILSSIHYDHEIGEAAADPYDHKSQAKALKKIHDAGFAGMFWWDLDFVTPNPYNWHVLRHAGSPTFLDRVLADDPATKVAFKPFLRINGIKRGGRYDPWISY